jgi:hypothetical protein
VGQKLDGKAPDRTNFEEGAQILRWLFEAQFTKLAPQDWIAFAQRTWREEHGTFVPTHDPNLARALRGFSLECLQTLWDQFDALTRIPLMVIRGANSDMLASTTLNAMLATSWPARSRCSAGSGPRATFGRAQGDTADCGLRYTLRRRRVALTGSPLRERSGCSTGRMLRSRAFSRDLLNGPVLLTATALRWTYK